MDQTPTVHSFDSGTPLGISGYTFADLHGADRLESLYDRFCEQVKADDPALWSEWDAYRQTPDASRPPIALSNLLMAMARHLSRFVTRLFQVESSADAIVQETRDQDDLFRFKVDFVRRRVLPLLKGGAPVASTPEDDQIVDRLIADASAEGASPGEARPWGRAQSGRGPEHRISRRARGMCADGSREGRISRCARTRNRLFEAMVRRACSRSRVSPLGHLSVSRIDRLLESRASRQPAELGEVAERGDGVPGDPREQGPPES